ncbi:MAG: rod shape-determining protein MreC [Oscillospiraceae bacterium]|nr:rod shape-determining protein MreC [Oscillospiraceae bacterium]
MGNFFKSTSFRVFLAVLFSSFIVLIVGVITKNTYTNSVLEFVIIPLQKLSASISDSFRKAIPISKTEEEFLEIINSQKKELEELRETVVDYQSIKKENEQYRQHYSIKPRNGGLKFEPAYVVGRSPDEDFSGFIISKGTAHNISKNDPVITSSGVIGLVTSPGPYSSVVKTIFSPDVKLGVVQKETGESGVVTGNIKLADKNQTKMMFLSKEPHLKEGDVVVTTGLSGLFPRDLPVGKVVEIQTNQEDASPFAVITPFENIKETLDVLVVVDFFGKNKIS